MNIRYDLIPQLGLNEVNKVLTAKLAKYNKNEWKYGIAWSEVINNLKKHLSEFELGHDYTEDNLLHIAEVAADALILAEYYKVYPNGDNRIIGSVFKPIVTVDLDDVIFSFIESYEKKFNVKMSDYWSGDYNMSDNLKELQKDKDFWVNMPVKHIPSFEVDYYVTAREIPKEWIEEAIQKNNLPKAPIYTVKWNESKIEQLKRLGSNVHIDDKYQTFKECHEAGIFCYLMDTPVNRRYNVGHRRIYDLNLDIK